MSMTETPTFTELVEGEIRRLAGLPAQAFRQIVDQDLRVERRPGSNPSQQQRVTAAALRSKDLVERWHTILLQMLVSVEGQLASAQEDQTAAQARFRRETDRLEREVQVKRGPAREAASRKLQEKQTEWLLTREKYATARAGRLRFKSGLDEWLIEARSLRDQYRATMYDSVVTEERNHYARVAGDLRGAISEHREAILADDALEPSAADERLWEHLR